MAKKAISRKMRVMMVMMRRTRMIMYRKMLGEKTVEMRKDIVAQMTRRMSMIQTLASLMSEPQVISAQEKR
jgi:hypothetical protein